MQTTDQLKNEIEHIEKELNGNLEDLVFTWQKKVVESENGYNATLDEYINDVDIRLLLENFIQKSSELLKTYIYEKIKPIDKRFFEVTEEFDLSKRIKSGDKEFWYKRIPKNITENFVDTFTYWAK